MGETHHTNEFYLESMYLDVHSLEQHPEGPAHLKTTSQALLQMAETPPAIVPGDCANGTIAGALSRHSTTLGTTQAIVPGDCAKGTIAVAQSRPPPNLRYHSSDSDQRLCPGHYRVALSRHTLTAPKLDFSKIHEVELNLQMNMLLTDWYITY
ncbi:hypothetical protein L6452_05326 [Arctium lappa]|uniref:Uncharacterized protein n=2 Tax=Arctium lappa TaxID=4217 RepID=A0ACB9DN60_ARCLA|nr:hypothetical protein L6452_11022 [Arctium lappa]KAI3757783.1 hypothetical protein L6452_05326 [Arctium lappa]